MRSSKGKDDENSFDDTHRGKPVLSSIFKSSTSPARFTNTSLQHTSQKQSKLPNKPVLQPNTATSAVLIAKTVQSFKMVNNAYQSQGRVGAALVTIRLQEGSYCQIMLYKDKQNHLCNTKILRGFKYHIQPNNYCTFYDNENSVWSILFDNKLDMADFNLQMAVIRWKAEDLSSVLHQDLWRPVSDESASSAAVGDTVEITYALRPLQEFSMVSGDLRDKREVEVVNSSWKKYLVGLQLGSEKIIIAQPSLMEELVPQHGAIISTVVMRLTVIKLNKSQKVSKEVESLNKTTSGSLKDLIPTRSEPAMVQNQADNSRSSPQSSTKADLISRMAKMGQPLPFKTAAPAPSDSDDTEAGNLYSAGTQLQSPLESQAQFNMFFSEMRTTNSELRMGITRLTDKVESLQSKFDNTEKRPNQEISSVLERLLDNEQQLKSQLQQILTTLHQSPPSSQNIPSGDQAAVGSCSRCTQLEQMEDRIRKLEKDNEYLQTSNTAQRDALFNTKIADKEQLARIEELQKQLAQEQTRTSDLNQNVEELERQRSKAEEESIANKKLITELQANIDSLESALRISEATKLEQVRRGLQEVLVSKDAVAEHIKQVMNSVFKCIKIQFEPQKSYDSTSIQSVLASTIKAVTMQYLGSLSDEGNHAKESQSSCSVYSNQDYYSEQSNGLEANLSTQSCDSISLETENSSQENLATSSIDNKKIEGNSHLNDSLRNTNSTSRSEIRNASASQAGNASTDDVNLVMSEKLKKLISLLSTKQLPFSPLTPDSLLDQWIPESNESNISEYSWKD